MLHWGLWWLGTTVCSVSALGGLVYSSLETSWFCPCWQSTFSLSCNMVFTPQAWHCRGSQGAWGVYWASLTPAPNSVFLWWVSNRIKAGHWLKQWKQIVFSDCWCKGGSWVPFQFVWRWPDVLKGEWGGRGEGLQWKMTEGGSVSLWWGSCVRCLWGQASEFPQRLGGRGPVLPDGYIPKELVIRSLRRNAPEW